MPKVSLEPAVEKPHPRAHARDRHVVEEIAVGGHQVHTRCNRERVGRMHSQVEVDESSPRELGTEDAS